MKRDNYLKDYDVSHFINWLIHRFDEENIFSHSYVDRRSKQTWSCNSVYDAYRKYRWSFSFRDKKDVLHKGTTYSENASALNKLRKNLREAYFAKDADALLSLSSMVLKWGGVSSWNNNWCNENRDRLLSFYEEGMKMLEPSIADDEGPFPERFNSGLTKIFSLLLDNFIIYDSRVGAALGYLAILYCQENQLRQVPSLLMFPWAPAKEAKSANPKTRNPSKGYLRIKAIRSPADHASWNLRASWLLKEASDLSRNFSGLPEPLRAVEAGLFMIGYDLGSLNKSKAVIPVKESVAEKTKYPLITHGKGHRFRADYNSNNETITFSYPVKKSGRKRADDIFTLNEIQRVAVYLQKKFTGRPFPLANNVKRLGNNDEIAGLGMAIRTLPQAVSKAQASSYLGPYLEEVGVFKLIAPHPARWSLIVKPAEVMRIIKSYHDHE